MTIIKNLQTKDLLLPLLLYFDDIEINNVIKHVDIFLVEFHNTVDHNTDNYFIVLHFKGLTS